MHDNLRDTEGTEETKTAGARRGGGTFHSIDLQPQKAAEDSFADYVKTLLEKLEQLKKDRVAFHNNLRQGYTNWANGGRRLLALLGALAFLLTGLAAVIRFASAYERFKPWDGYDIVAMVAALFTYAIMSSILGYDKATDKTTAYFRQVATILAIRDLWTKVQFAILKELRSMKDADPPVTEAIARERLRVLAEAFCADLDKVASGELTEFRTEFIASLAELDAAARKGTEDITKQLEAAAKAAQQAATEAKAAAKAAEEKAASAASALEAAIKPGALNIIIAGEFDDSVVILVDGVERESTTGKQVAIDRVAPGARKIGARAKKGAKALETSLMVDVKPGATQDVRLALS